MRGQRTIAVLSPGEMGSQVGRVLREGGARVVTFIEGRTDPTRQRAAAAGLEMLPSLDRLVEEAGLVVAVVPPLSAEPLARRVAAAMLRQAQHERPGTRRPIYCDANSIGPQTARTIDQVITAAGGQFVDGSIIGGANGLRARTTVYLSGELAEAVSEQLHPLRTSVLGSEPGQASAFKVLYAGLTKGLSALGVELLAGAHKLGIFDLLMDKYRGEHSGVGAFFENTLPGLPPRAGRRAEEMTELTQTLEGLSLTAHTSRAAEAVLAAVADRYRGDGGPDEEELEAFVSWWAG